MDVFRRSPWMTVVLSLLIAFLLLSTFVACSRSRPTPSPTPSPLVREEAIPQPTTRPEGAHPSPTVPPRPSTPSPTPVPLPPAVIDFSPRPGSEVPPDTPIEIRFSAKVDPQSVRKSLSIHPQVDGALEVRDNVVRFSPRTPFPWDTDVTVRLKSGLKSVHGLAMPRPLIYRFHTMTPLRVTRHYPMTRAVRVSIDTVVRLMFNRAVVPLDRTNQALSPPSWLRIEPHVAGHVRWVGTSLLEFVPRDYFLSGTVYTVTVAPPLRSVDGAPLLSAQTFTFTTAFPRVERVAVSAIDEYVWPNKPFTVTFTLPMDRASVEEGIRLERVDDGTLVPVTFSWVDDRTVEVLPKRDLALGQVYRLTVDTRVRAADGRSTLRSPFRKTVRVVPPLSLKSSKPYDGQRDVNPYDPVYIIFRGIPDPDTLPDNIVIEPQPRVVYSHTVQTRLILDFPKEGQTTYTITLKGDIKDVFGHALGKDIAIHFTTGDYPPQLWTNWPYGHVMLPHGEPISLTVRERNVAGVTLGLYTVQPESLPDVFSRGGMYRCSREMRGKLLREWRVSFPQKRNTWHVVHIPIEVDSRPPDPGVYLFCLQGEGFKPGKTMEPLSYMLVVSPYNITVKSANNRHLAWVTDLRSGAPVSGVKVAFYAPTFLDETTTDDKGMAWSEGAREHMWESVWALAYSPEGEVVGVGTDGWNEGIGPWAFHLPVDYRNPQGLVAYVQTDRLVYRPGQTIHWKLIVRRDNDGAYALPEAGTRLQLNVMDPTGEVVLQQDVTLNEMGTASGDLPLSPDAAIGYYNMWVDGVEMLGESTLLVAAYRKPEFEIQMTPDRPEVIDGETVRVTTRARYYFGAPVANAALDYAVVDEPYHFTWTCPTPPCPDYSFSDEDWWTWMPESEQGKPIARGKGRTDAEGRFVLSLPARLKPEQGSRRWKVEVAIHDVSGQVISGRTWVVVHKAAVYPGIAVDRYVAQQGTPVTTRFILVDTQGHPVPGKEVTFVAYRLRWHNVRKRGPDGVFRWVSEVEETPVYTSTVHLDGEGRGTASFVPPKGGSYRLRAIAKDDQGREARSGVFIWVSDRTYVSWRRENNNRLFLVADKKLYRVGETAHVLIPSPYNTPVHALVTLERGLIRKAWTVTLKSNSEILDIPITEDMAPNVFLSVVIVQGAEEAMDGQPSFRVGYVELPVDVSSRLLTVRVEPERHTYRPRDEARFTLSVSDQKGQPVDAEVAVALVDKAVLALFDRPTPLAQIFYRRRGLQVRTGTSLAIAPRRVRWAEEPGGKGGGGGGGGVPPLREEFLDVAYWKPALRMGPHGTARVRIPLPDNLTTWTLLAWAVDKETRVGQGEADILVSQDFLLRPVLPRFFTRGDKATIGVVAHNLSDTPLSGRVTLHVEGARLKDRATQEFTLQPGQNLRLNWRIEDVQGRGDEPTLRVTWQGTTDVPGIGDAVRMTVPVHYPVPADVLAVAGMLAEDGERMEVFAVPPGRVPNMGGLRLDLDASLGAGVLEGLKYLRHYRWECSEQTTSRFLANVVTWRTLRRLGVENEELDRVLPDLVRTAIRRLQEQQHPDGGWGWWGRGRSNPYLTAYALWALTEAKQAGFDVPEEMWARAATYLHHYIRSYKPGDRAWQNNRAAMVLFSLANYQEERHVLFSGVYAAAVNLFHAREHMSLYGKALLGLTFGTFSESALLDANAAESSRAYLERILDELVRHAVVDPTGAHWEEKQWDAWHMNNDVHTTAVVFLLLTRYDHDNPLNPQIVRWLMTQRQGNRWHHTHDTAWALVALTDWMESTGELHPDYDYTAWLNGDVWLQGTMSEEDVGKTQTAWAPLSHLDLEGLNRVLLERTHRAGQRGTGALYYRLQLMTYVPLEGIHPVSRGIRVERWFTVGEEDTPVSKARVGDVVTVHVRVIAARALHYLMLEDFFPAGVEPLDVRLKTTSSQVKGIRREREGRWPWWYWSPTHTELRDDRAGVFEQYLQAGTYEITYQVRASIPGTFVVPPARASLMYEPEVYGWSSPATFVVEPGE